MPTFEESLVIAAPVKRVFGLLADMDRVATWMPHIVEAQRTSKIESGVGAELAVLVKAGGRESKGTSRCIESDPPRRLVIESSLDLGITSTMAFDLVSQGRSQTHLTATIAYTIAGRGFGRLLGGLFGDKIARADIKAALENLKRVIEAAPSRAPRRRAATTPPR